MAIHSTMALLDSGRIVAREVISGASVGHALKPDAAAGMGVFALLTAVRSAVEITGR
ncbi:hypothetical protein [Mycobacterium paraterrae]|uniref:Uncharacterized protein n=1 Tax=Mycobacterium paraterrae TaxID=577492 RepID=A0ABY3VMU9_9MYCO|nr:hypothetical protein [Mycobacterium paraterrae]UMB70735.1 hypothetical protein MKK62_05370 [Mycobacterium paraterrae]